MPSEVLIRLSVENIAPVSLNDVVVRRALPENFELSEGPEYDINDGELIGTLADFPSERVLRWRYFQE